MKRGYSAQSCVIRLGIFTSQLLFFGAFRLEKAVTIEQKKMDGIIKKRFNMYFKIPGR